MFNNASERKMTALAEASNLVRKVAEPCPAGDSVKAAIGRAARHLRWTYNRTRSLWYADERCSVSAAEIDELRRVAGARRKEQEAEARHELLGRIEALEARLNQIDPEFYRDSVHSLRRSVGRMGREDTSVG